MSSWEIDYLAISAFGFGVFFVLVAAGVATVVLFLVGFFKDRWTLVPWTLLPAIASLIAYYTVGSLWLAQWARVSAKKSGILVLGYQTVDGMARMASGYVPDFIAHGLPVAGAGALVGLVLYAVLRAGRRLGSKKGDERPRLSLDINSARTAGARGGAFGKRASAIAVLIVAVVAASTWWAWDRGWIPGNMRAPTKEAFEAGIRESLPLLGVPESPLCVSPTPFPAPESQNAAGFLPNPPLPGAYAVVLVDQGKELRDKQLAQYRYFAKAGFFTEEATTIADTEGKATPAYRFLLTLEGWLNSEPGRICFRVGQREFSAVTDFVPSGKSALGIEAWRVTYLSAVKRPAAWASSDSAKLLFSGLQAELQGTPKIVEMYRGNERWVSAAEVSLSPRGGDDIRNQVLAAHSAAPATLSQAEVLEAIARNQQASKLIQDACLALPEPYSFGPVQQADSYVMKVFNLVQGYPPTSMQLAAWRKLEILTRAGVFDRTVSNETANTLGAPAHGAVTYSLKEPYRQYFFKPNCLKMSSLAIDKMLIERASDGAQYRFFAHAALKDPLPWIAEPALAQLPEIELARTQGIVMHGNIGFQARNDGPSASTAYVSVLAAARDLSAEPVPSESIRELRKLASTSVASRPAPGGKGPVPLLPAAKPPSTVTPATTTGPRFPAGAAAVHVVAIYKSSSKDATVEVEITDKTKPVLLMLSAYEATQWNLRVAKGVKLTRAIALGYNRQAVAGLSGGVQAESFSANEGSRLGYLTLGNNRDDRLDLLDKVLELTGKFPETVQGLSSRILVDGKRTEPLPPQENIGVTPGTDVILVAPGIKEMRSGVQDSGLSAQYPCKGGSTVYFASRGHASGKVYWELQGKFIQGGPEAGTRAGVGLWRGGYSDLSIDALDRDMKRTFSDADVIGFAMDLDSGHVYWHVNGKWAIAEPESNAGKRLKPRHAYFAVINVAPGCNALGRGDTWTANFGKSKFRHAIPKGYKSYDGRQSS